MKGWAGGLRGAVETVLLRRHRFGWIRQFGPSDNRLNPQLDLLHVVSREHSAADYIEPGVDVVDSHLHPGGGIIEDAPAIGLGRWFCNRYMPAHPNPSLYYKRDYDQAREYILENYTSRNYWTDCWTFPKRLDQ